MWIKRGNKQLKGEVVAFVWTFLSQSLIICKRKVKRHLKNLITRKFVFRKVLFNWKFINENLCLILFSRQGGKIKGGAKATFLYFIPLRWDSFFSLFIYFFPFHFHLLIFHSHSDTHKRLLSLFSKAVSVVVLSCCWLNKSYMHILWRMKSGIRSGWRRRKISVEGK